MTTFYAAWNRDDNVLRESTSGGAFSAFAEKVLMTGGVVVGASYGKRLEVRHEVVDSLDGLKLLRGVKYVYGVIDRAVYGSMRKALAGGRDVLFVGLPCQSAAVRKMFGDAANLLVCDLVCFGAPPQTLWRKYVDWMARKQGKRLIDVNPRDKFHGWGRKTYYRYEWEDGKVTRKLSLFDPYAQAFYSTLGFRKCCFACPFRGLDRVSDITLCDFWGAERLGLSPNVMAGGVSGVAVHTKKGAEAFAAANLERVEVDKEDFVAGNVPVVSSATMPAMWADFAEDVKAMDFGGLVRKYKLQVTKTQVAYQWLRSCAARLVRRILLRAIAL